MLCLLDRQCETGCSVPQGKEAALECIVEGGQMLYLPAGAGLI